MSIRRFKRMGAKPKRSLPDKLLRSVQQAHELMERKEWAGAQHLLTGLNKQSPNREEILAPLALTHYHLNELPAYLTLCVQLNKLLPNHPEHRLALAHAYLMNGRIVLAYLTFQQFLDRWPGHEDAGRARETFDRIESEIGSILEQLELSGDQASELAALHEESQVLMEAGKYREGIAKAEELLKRKPDYTAAYNNISLMQYHNGEIAKALANAEHVLKLDPDNFHALSNLSRYLLVNGRQEEALRHTEHLKRVECEYFDRWIKQAEACAMLGDDRGVLDALGGAEETGLIETGINGFYIYHLAATAQSRLGHENEARDLWGKCLRLSPSYIVAMENLDDLDAPLHERNGPWSFALSHWISQRAIDDLHDEAQKASRRGVKNLASTIQRFLRKHPQVEHLLPILLDRGDPQGRDFAVNFAGWAKTPETIAMLREFALGQKGADQLRMKAMQGAQRLGGLDPGIVRFWSKGDWQEMRLHKTDITYEVESNLPPGAYDLYLESYEALNNRDGIQSEKLLKQALEIVPDSPQLLNNLSAAYALQGRLEESLALARQILAKHPDYLFARTNIANRLIDDGKYEEALDLLKPLAEWDRLHVSEAAALYNTYIHLYFRRSEMDAARQWLVMLERVAPADSHIELWRQQFDQVQRDDRFRSLPFRK